MNTLLIFWLLAGLLAYGIFAIGILAADHLGMLPQLTAGLLYSALPAAGRKPP